MKTSKFETARTLLILSKPFEGSNPQDICVVFQVGRFFSMMVNDASRTLGKIVSPRDPELCAASHLITHSLHRNGIMPS